MINSLNDILEPLREIFLSANSGDTLTIWDQYFIGSMDFSNVEILADTISNIGNIRHVVVYIDDYKLNSDTRNGDGLEALKNLREVLYFRHIKFEVFDYSSRKDRKNRIHGRYWLSDNSGFLMDGSLDGVVTNLCIAITMDEFTFERIHNVLEKRKQRSAISLIWIILRVATQVGWVGHGTFTSAENNDKLFAAQ